MRKNSLGALEKNSRGRISKFTGTEKCYLAFVVKSVWRPAHDQSQILPREADALVDPNREFFMNSQ